MRGASAKAGSRRTEVSAGSATWSAAFASAARSAMDVYDEVMVPRIFEPWGHALLDHVGVERGDAVLDVACGPGSVTRLAASRAGSDGRVLGCDHSMAMLAIARSKALPVDGAPIEYVEAPAEELPAPDASFDVAVCQQGLQFFPDRLSALVEMRRVLRVGGRVGVAVWAEIERCPPFAALDGAIRRVVGSETGDRYRGGPWGLSNRDELRELLQRAGFRDVRVIRGELPVIFEGGPDQLARTLAAAGIAGELSALSAHDRRRLEHEIREQAHSLMVSEELRSHLTSHLATAHR
jgi:ubiquinone/menaquinone biosynthesis C-methylase UbiE